MGSEGLSKQVTNDFSPVNKETRASQSRKSSEAVHTKELGKQQEPSQISLAHRYA